MNLLGFSYLKFHISVRVRVSQNVKTLLFSSFQFCFLLFICTLPLFFKVLGSSVILVSLKKNKVSWVVSLSIHGFCFCFLQDKAVFVFVCFLSMVNCGCLKRERDLKELIRSSVFTVESC